MVHLPMKFLSDEMQAITLKWDKKKAHECYKKIFKEKKLGQVGGSELYTSNLNTVWGDAHRVRL